MNAKRILICTLFAALVGSCYWLYRGKTMKRGANRFTTMQVEEGPIQGTVEATGSVSPLNRVEIKPPISGRIEKLLADEGDSVKEGQVLAWMS